MSCYIMNNENFDFIISFLQDKRCTSLAAELTEDGVVEYVCFDRHNKNYSLAKCEELMQVLIDQNVESFNARYPKHAEKPITYTYSHLSVEDVISKKNAELLAKKEEPMLSPATLLLGILSCYDYQASEVVSYETSRARYIVENIRLYAISQLPGWFHCWGI